jgi:L-amino acid N-acyltransferase
MDVGIREATDADLAGVTAIFNEQIASSVFVYAESLVTLDDRRAWWGRHAAGGFPVLVAVDAGQPGEVIGWGSLSPYRASSGYRFTAEVSVYVAPAAHRCGVGTRLVTELIDRAQAIGMHALVASIDAGNAPSVALFERLGFVECARLPEVGRKFGEWRTQVLLHRRVEG